MIIVISLLLVCLLFSGGCDYFDLFDISTAGLYIIFRWL